MKKAILVCALVFLMISVSYAINVQREMTPATDFGEQIEITFIINPEGAQNFEFTDSVPSGWEFVSWSVEGISTDSVFFSERTPGLFETPNTIYRWVFENAQGPITLKYHIVAYSVGEVSLNSVWMYDGQIGSQDSEIFVRSTGVVCGDGICYSAYGQNVFNCPEDCPFKTTSYFWISLLLLASIIVVSGIIYKEYKKIRTYKNRIEQPPKFEVQKTILSKAIKKPEKIIHFEIKEKIKIPPFPKMPKLIAPPKPAESKQIKKPRAKTSTVKMKSKKLVKKPKTKKTAKKIARKPKRSARKSKKITKKSVKKAKKSVKKEKTDKFYKDTLSRLEKIKKELK